MGWKLNGPLNRRSRKSGRSWAKQDRLEPVICLKWNVRGLQFILWHRPHLMWSFKIREYSDGRHLESDFQTKYDTNTTPLFHRYYTDTMTPMKTCLLYGFEYLKLGWLWFRWRWRLVVPVFLRGNSAQPLCHEMAPWFVHGMATFETDSLDGLNWRASKTSWSLLLTAFDAFADS